jgi:O-antigen/teichoic acid export membrane protein
MLVVQSFQLGFLPLAYKKLGSPNDKRYFSKILTYYTALLAFSVLSISLFGKEFIELFVKNKDYWFASSVIPIVALAFLVRGIQYNFSLSFHFEKKTNYVTLIIFVTSAINVFLSIFLVKITGFIGAAYSLLISSILMMIISYYYGQKIFQINYELIKMTKILALSFALYFVSFLFQNSGLTINIIIKSILIISFPLIIYKLSIFDEVEIKSLKRGINDFLNRIK